MFAQRGDQVHPAASRPSCAFIAGANAGKQYGVPPTKLISTPTAILTVRSTSCVSAAPPQRGAAVQCHRPAGPHARTHARRTSEYRARPLSSARRFADSSLQNTRTVPATSPLRRPDASAVFLERGVSAIRLRGAACGTDPPLLLQPRAQPRADASTRAPAGVTPNLRCAPTREFDFGSAAVGARPDSLRRIAHLQRQPHDMQLAGTGTLASGVAPGRLRPRSASARCLRSRASTTRVRPAKRHTSRRHRRIARLRLAVGASLSTDPRRWIIIFGTKRSAIGDSQSPNRDHARQVLPLRQQGRCTRYASS